MSVNCLQYISLFILLISFVGQGDGQWKKSPRDVLERDIRLYKKESEKLKQEFEDFYSEYSNEPINDYFLEEIDYVQSKIKKFLKSKMKRDENKPRINSKANFSEGDIYDENLNKNRYSNNMSISSKNVEKFSNEKYNNTRAIWPKFDDILLAIGKKYDWKNDRWIKVKSKIKDKDKSKFEMLKNSAEHQKHNFKYKFVRLNRPKTKRKLVIAVTAVR